MQQPTIDFLIDLSKEAGEILKDGFGKVHQIQYKGQINLVTEIDRQSEDLLISRIHAAFPNHSIVAEESGFHDGDNEHRWFIDPVDGTSNYAKGFPLFCVSIAYAYQGQMRLAAVYDPLRDESFYSEKGQGAWLNGSRIHVTTTEKLIEAMLVTGFPYDMHQKQNNLDNFSRLSLEVQTIRRFGSAVLDQAYVASGRLDGYWEIGVNAWDVAAGTLLIEEAGGLVTTVTGDADYFKPPFDMLAANPALHPKLLKILNEEK
jgi:myo-inositol-1(or 4)-monophosphatase